MSYHRIDSQQNDHQEEANSPQLRKRHHSNSLRKSNESQTWTCWTWRVYTCFVFSACTISVGTTVTFFNRRELWRTTAPDSATNSIGISCWCDIKPRAEKTANPATKLVQLLRTHSHRLSLQADTQTHACMWTRTQFSWGNLCSHLYWYWPPEKFQIQICRRHTCDSVNLRSPSSTRLQPSRCWLYPDNNLKQKWGCWANTFQ